MILNRDRFAILSDIWGRFRSLSLISPVTPEVEPGDDGFLWIDIGVDGTPDNPLWKMWDEHAAIWRLIGGGAGAVSWDDVTGKPATFPPETHTHSKLVASDGSPDPALSADAAGRVSLPYQPCFLAYNSANDTDVTGDRTNVTVDFDTEVFDVGNNFASDVFTAPVTGRYLLIANVRIGGISGHTEGYMQIITSNRQYQTIYNTGAVAMAGIMIMQCTAIADMDASDTAYVNIAVYGGSKVVDVLGDATHCRTYFAGMLLA